MRCFEPGRPLGFGEAIFSNGEESSAEQEGQNQKNSESGQGDPEEQVLTGGFGLADHFLFVVFDADQSACGFIGTCGIKKHWRRKFDG